MDVMYILTGFVAALIFVSNLTIVRKLFSQFAQQAKVWWFTHYKNYPAARYKGVFPPWTIPFLDRFFMLDTVLYRLRYPRVPSDTVNIQSAVAGVVTDKQMVDALMHVPLDKAVMQWGHEYTAVQPDSNLSERLFSGEL